MKRFYDNPEEDRFLIDSDLPWLQEVLPKPFIIFNFECLFFDGHHRGDP